MNELIYTDKNKNFSELKQKIINEFNRRNSIDTRDAYYQNSSSTTIIDSTGLDYCTTETYNFNKNPLIDLIIMDDYGKKTINLLLDVVSDEILQKELNSTDRTLLKKYDIIDDLTPYYNIVNDLENYNTQSTGSISYTGNAGCRGACMGLCTKNCFGTCNGKNTSTI